MKKIFIFTNTEQPFTINDITFKNNVRLEIKEEELENLRKNSYFRNMEGKFIKVIIKEQTIEEIKEEIEDNNVIEKNEAEIEEENNNENEEIKEDNEEIKTEIEENENENEENLEEMEEENDIENDDVENIDYEANVDETIIDKKEVEIEEIKEDKENNKTKRKNKR